MTVRRTIFLTALLALITSMLPLTSASAEDALVSRDFDIQTVAGGAPSDGSAHAWGTVNFTSKSSFTISGRVNDRCPADGYGAYLRVQGAYANEEAILSRPVADDTHQCDASPNGYPFSKSFTPEAGRTVKWVILTLFEIDRSADPDRYGNQASSRQIFNPLR